MHIYIHTYKHTYIHTNIQTLLYIWMLKSVCCSMCCSICWIACCSVCCSVCCTVAACVAASVAVCVLWRVDAQECALQYVLQYVLDCTLQCVLQRVLQSVLQRVLQRVCYERWRLKRRCEFLRTHTRTCKRTHAHIHDLSLSNTHVYARHTCKMTNACVLSKKEWCRVIGCLIFIGHFLQKSPIISGSFVQNDLQHASGEREMHECLSNIQYDAWVSL